IHAREILDSRGNPTVEVDLITNKGLYRDSDKPRAVDHINKSKGVPLYRYGKDATNVGDEGGFAPNILENKEALELLKSGKLAKIEEELGNKAKFAGR
nr:phosphopyruvate hydratase (EC 4.2.1.11) alpha / tau-crystallin - sea lamprey (fragments) [Petromyzon marinus]